MLSSMKSSPTTNPVNISHSMKVIWFVTLTLILTLALSLPVLANPKDGPVISDPPATYTFNHCDGGQIDFEANDTENEIPFTWDIAGTAGGTITSTGDKTARWEWSGPTVPQSGTPILEVRARDAQGTPGPWISIDLTVENNPPIIMCPDQGVTTWPGDTASQTVTIWDDDACDDLVLYTDYAGPGFLHIEGTEIHFSPNEMEIGDMQITVTVSDGALTNECILLWNVITGPPYCYRFEIGVISQPIGHNVDIPVLMETAPYQWEGIGSFDLTVAYDNTALGFLQATEGDIYTECGWEYFSYQHIPRENCGGDTSCGLIRIIGVADTDSDPGQPGCESPIPYVGTQPAVMATLSFQVRIDYNLTCEFLPIRFFWTDCGDNSLYDADGTQMYISSKVYDYDNPSPINDYQAGFSTYLGAPDDCLAIPEHPLRAVEFWNGGVDVACTDSVISHRGDINLNGVSYEVADAVLFARYFIEGFSVFTDIVASTERSDCNADGTPLMLADLVYLIRVAVGDAPLPYLKNVFLPALFRTENGILSIDADIAAARVVLTGRVTPTLLTNDIEMMYAFDGVNTRVLLFTTEAKRTFTGEFLHTEAEIVDVEFATYDGRPIAIKETPGTFALEQNYPNPFNPTTTISFNLPEASEYIITIYDITGRLVESISGEAPAGPVSVDWNATNRASGVYLYRVTAGVNSASRKMLLLK